MASFSATAAVGEESVVVPDQGQGQQRQRRWPPPRRTPRPTAPQPDERPGRHHRRGGTRPRTISGSRIRRVREMVSRADRGSSASVLDRGPGSARLVRMAYRRRRPRRGRLGGRPACDDVRDVRARTPRSGTGRRSPPPRADPVKERLRIDADQATISISRGSARRSRASGPAGPASWWLPAMAVGRRGSRSGPKTTFWSISNR